MQIYIFFTKYAHLQFKICPFAAHFFFKRNPAGFVRPVISLECHAPYFSWRTCFCIQALFILRHIVYISSIYLRYIAYISSL